MTIKEKILTSIQPVIKNSHFVSIDDKHIEHFAKKLLEVELPAWDKHMQFVGNEEQTIQYYFFVDSLNFCSWAKKGEERWQIQKDGEWIHGYYALSYALKRAVESDSNFLKASYLALIHSEEFKDIFRGKGTWQLSDERYKIIKENFSILQEKYNGQAKEILKRANFDANKIVELLLNDFPSFQDTTVFNDQPVYFLKRAQLFTSDVNFALRNKNTEYIHSLHNLTIFADNLLPQLLQYQGVLVYNEELLQKIKQEELLSAGSQEEIEIRTNTIYACELLRDTLEQLGKNIASNELDWILWTIAKKTSLPLPPHRTITIAY